MTADQPVLPSGTVTFLFTDIEGSTRLWEEWPAEMAVALERHDEVLRSVIEGRGGFVFSTAGDAFAAAFSGVADACGAAVDAQRLLGSEPWPGGLSVLVRMGLHVGESFERDGDYFGPTLNRAARIMSLGHGGQVLVSAAVASLIDDSGLGLQPVGEVALKGLARSEVVSQLVAAGLAEEFPPLMTRPVAVGNLPVPRDSMVGRDRELTELVELLGSNRLVTLTGVGGVGKTRLALAAAGEVSGFGDGVWFVDLAAVADGGLVAQEVANSLQLQLPTGGPVPGSVVSALAPQRSLVVLDNCEHLIDGVAEFADALLSEAAEMVLLATSREGLGVAGEQLVAVAPLGAFDVDSAGVRLFLDRAAETGWSPGPGELNAVVELCGHLDGMPLAIELAAARSRSMGVNTVLDRIGERFRLLKGRRRSIERHQTLSATVRWSYDLLDESEQRLFDRLSVFLGSFDLEAAERVCADEVIEVFDVVEVLAALVDKSMVAAADGRYRLLETLRQFGEDQLVEHGDPDLVRGGHASYFHGFVLEAHNGLLGPDESEWWQRLRDSWPDVRASLRWHIDSGDVHRAAELVAHVAWVTLWHEPHEPYEWAREVLTLPGAQESPFFTTCATLAGWGAYMSGDWDELKAFADLAIKHRTDTDVDQLSTHALAVFELQRNSELGEAILADQAERCSRVGDHTNQSLWLASVAMSQSGRGELTQALTTAEQALALAEPTGNPAARSWALWVQSAALAGTDPQQAIAAMRDALALAESADVTWVILFCRRALGDALVRAGDPHAGLDSILTGIEGYRRQGGWAHVWLLLVYAATALEALGQPVTAAQILGACLDRPAARVPRVKRRLAELEQNLHTTLGATVFADQLATGRSLTAPQAADLVTRASTTIDRRS